MMLRFDPELEIPPDFESDDYANARAAGRRGRRENTPGRTGAATAGGRGSRARSPSGAGGGQEERAKATRFRRECPPPSRITARPSPFAINKIQQFQLCDIWYFTSEGRREAAELQHAIAEETFGLSKTDDGLALRPMAAFKPSRKVVPDSQLSWEQIMQGKAVMLAEMQRAGWNEKHLLALSKFYWDLDNHDLRSETWGTAAIVLYHARIRRSWHESLQRDEGFNIAIISEDVLRQAVDDVLNASRVESIGKLNTLIEEVKGERDRRSSGALAPRGPRRGQDVTSPHHAANADATRGQMTAASRTLSVEGKEIDRPPHRLFEKAHDARASQRAPSVWGGTGTRYPPAHQLPHGMESQQDAGATRAAALSTRKGSSYAPTGSAQEDAAPPTPTTSTNAPAVANSITVLTNVLKHRAHEAFTPLQADQWEFFLRKANLLRRIGRIVAHELKAERYLGPLSRAEVESLIGPFQSSPLGIIPKTKPNTYRLIQDYSFPRTPTPLYSSINSAINSSDYPCTWGTFTTFCLLLARLPPGSQAAVRDVAEAYRNIPLASSQWPGTVVRVDEDDKFVIDTSTSFGCKPNAGVYGNVDDAACDIIRSVGMGPISKWVDDHVFIRILCIFIGEYNRRRKEWHRKIAAAGGRHHEGGRIWYGGDRLPDGRTEEFDEDMSFPIVDLSHDSPRPATDTGFSYNLQDINRVTTRLGIPWQESKDIDFANEFPYTGFVWNISAQTVAISPEKKEKYRAAITAWQASRMHALREVQQLYGKLLHASLVIPAGRAYLTNLEAMLGIFGDRPFMPRTPPLRPLMTSSGGSTSSRAHPFIGQFPAPAFSDASSGVGIAIVINGRWRAWRLLPGWKRDGREIGWAEAVGFELLVQTILQHNDEHPHFKVFGDNKGVVEGWWNGRSRNRQVNAVFRRVHAKLDDCGCVAHSRYVVSASNPADDPSRGIYPPSSLLLPPVPIPEELRAFIIDFDAPFTAAETGLQRQGELPKPLAKEPRDSTAIARAYEGFERDRQNDELLRDELEEWE
ncbi:hypothetical protein A0H81_06526 [Grifola frondosa]|uniref:Uncharacterized protein n=1 Tax=Grifola frondosa TaxID=5627 RepID=A0A1C7M9I3_GRIFR|nr:hypothetical protein A0H81_06526 [Grifola frondosa]